MFYDDGPKLGTSFCPRHKILNNRKTHPKFVILCIISTVEITHTFYFLKYVISGPVLQIGGSKFKTGSKLGHFTVGDAPEMKTVGVKKTNLPGSQEDHI